MGALRPNRGAQHGDKNSRSTILDVMTPNTPEDTIRGEILLVLAPTDGSSAMGPSGVLLALQELHPELTENDFHRQVDLLESRGLVRTQRAANNTPYVLDVEAEGREAAADFARKRVDRVARVRQLQDDYLRWLYLEIEHENRSPTPDDYLATNPSFYGLPYTAAELLKAGSRLRDAAFIEGPDSDQYDAPLRPALTVEGRRTVESNRSVHDESHHGASIQNIHNNVAGHANVNFGNNVTQNLSVNAPWTAEVQEFLDAVAQAAPTMSEDLRADIEPYLEDGRQGVIEQQPSKVKAAIEGIRGFLSAATSGALGNILATQVPALLSLLG